MSRDPKQIKKNQHTVPQCYLRGFADEQQGLFSFNKMYQSAKQAGVSKSACFDYYYDFDPATLENPDDDPQWAENTFALLEGRFREVLDACLVEAEAGELSVKNGSYLAQFVAIQWLRTVSARKVFVEADVKLNQAVVDQLYKQLFPGMRPGKFVNGSGYEQRLHASMMLDYPIIISTAERFSNKPLQISTTFRLRTRSRPSQQ